jgi:hypothetical protein
MRENIKERDMNSAYTITSALVIFILDGHWASFTMTDSLMARHWSLFTVADLLVVIW